MSDGLTLSKLLAYDIGNELVDIIEGSYGLDLTDDPDDLRDDIINDIDSEDFGRIMAHCGDLWALERNLNNLSIENYEVDFPGNLRETEIGK